MGHLALQVSNRSGFVTREAGLHPSLWVNASADDCWQDPGRPFLIHNNAKPDAGTNLNRDPKDGEPEMAQTQELKTAVEETEAWLDEFMGLIGWHNRDLAFRALVTGLHALRDSLPWDEAANLAGYFPPLLRGFYFEGWHPASPLLPLTSRATFFERIHDAIHHAPGAEPEQVTRVLFMLLARRLPQSELEDVKAVGSEELHGYWPI